MPSFSRLLLRGVIASLLASPALAQGDAPPVSSPTLSLVPTLPTNSPADEVSQSASTGLEDSETTETQPETTLATSKRPSSSSSSSSSTTTTRAITTVVSIFYIDVQGDEERGMPYTMLHRNAGSVLGVNDDGENGDATTYVITGTRTTPRDTLQATAPDAADETSTPTSLPASLARVTSSNEALEESAARRNKTGQPSTVTQGPSTFLVTVNRGDDRTVVNRCRLEGLTWATCDMTHIGTGWYTRKKPDFSGEWSTYNYTWTSGDRFGFAPVTITAGVEKLGAASQTGGGDDGEEDAVGGRVALLKDAMGLAIILGGAVAGFVALL